MTRDLASRLQSISEKFAEKVPRETQEAMHAATEELQASGQAERALGEGDALPPFELPNQHEQPVRSRDLLAGGPLVLSFFRGHW